MSTELPTSPHGFTLVASESLGLVRELAALNARMISRVLSGLRDHGFSTLTEPQLVFLGELDCGVNHAAELARRLGVTRQAIHKSVRDLSDLGWLETKAHPELGNQRVILFTPEGERLMAQARKEFAMLDKQMNAQLGEGGVAALTTTLTGL